MTGAISTIFPNWNHAQGEAALQKRKSDSFTALPSRTLSSKFHIVHMVSLYLLNIWSLLSCLFLCGPFPIRLKVAPKKCFSCLSAFAHVVLSSRGNHSFLLSQPGLLLFPVILLEMCGDVSVIVVPVGVSVLRGLHGPGMINALQSLGNSFVRKEYPIHNPNRDAIK